MSEQDKFNKKINFLKNSAVFAMSLSGKELFHSNIWAWLCERDAEFAKAFSPSFAGVEKVFREEKFTLYRENKNGKFCSLDVVLHTKNENVIFAIENKFKSIPSETQLSEYKTAIEKNGKTLKKGVFTGILEKSEISVEPWEYVPYEKIISQIRAKIETSKLTDDEKKIVAEYCDVTDAIREVLEIALRSSEKERSLDDPKIIFDDTRNNKKGKNLLDEIRIYDIFQKLKMEHFRNWFLEEYKEKVSEFKFEIPEDFEFESKIDFSHGSAAVQFIFVKKDEKGSWEKAIGIQIQDNKYRRIVQETGKNLNEIFENYTVNDWFDKNPKNGKTIWGIEGRVCKMRGKYCKYGENFVNQHCALEGDWKKVSKWILNDLDLAKKLL